jgi:hypothetical protein
MSNCELSRVLQRPTDSYVNHDQLQNNEVPSEIYSLRFNVCRITPSSKKNYFTVKNRVLLKVKIHSNIIFTYLIFQILGQARDTETSLLRGIVPQFLDHMAYSLAVILTDLLLLPTHFRLEVVVLLVDAQTKHLNLDITLNHGPSN